MDGGGCDFWKWEEDYEQWLVDNKHVPPSYQPVFQSTKMPQPEDGGQLEQLKYLTGIARDCVLDEMLDISLCTCTSDQFVWNC